MLPTETSASPRLQSLLHLHRWPVEKATDWFDKHGWPVGCNYIPQNAINQLEMWQAETFDPFLIDRELSWAEGLGFNTVRVFLHDKAYAQDPNGFLDRMELFISISYKHNIRPLFVFWDSCWNPYCEVGKQPEPVPNVHNSGWVQSPGVVLLLHEGSHPILQEYITAVVTRFKHDTRVLGWDLFNEPNHKNSGSYNEVCREDAILGLLQKTVQWVRAIDPVQPITMGVYEGDWHPHRLQGLNSFMLQNSDWISFHCYKEPAGMEASIQDLLLYNRPIICTEYMARPVSTFQQILPVLAAYKVGGYCWGLVAGKTQTHCHWNTWGNTALSSCQLGVAGETMEDGLWFHDVLHPDGSPFDPEEVTFLQQLASQRSLSIVPQYAPTA